MRRVLAALVDLAMGLLLVAIAFFLARVLLQSRTLVYSAFPLVCIVCFAIGYWRRRRSEIPFALTVILATVPLFILAAEFFSGRDKPFIVLPIVAVVFIVLGGFISRPVIAASFLLGASIAAAFAGPLFIQWLVPSNDVVERPVAFILHTVDGRTISSQELRGRVVVLDFWATWCVPCQRELPALQRVYEKAGSDVAFFAIDGVMSDSGTEDGDTAERAAAYFRRAGYTLPLVWDEHATLEKSLAVHGFPTLLLLDARGSVRLRRVGFVGSEDLEALLKRKIKQVRD